jgi:hypothetical protein
MRCKDFLFCCSVNCKSALVQRYSRIPVITDMSGHTATATRRSKGCIVFRIGCSLHMADHSVPPEFSSYGYISRLLLLLENKLLKIMGWCSSVEYPLVVNPPTCLQSKFGISTSRITQQSQTRKFRLIAKLTTGESEAHNIL